MSTEATKTRVSKKTLWGLLVSLIVTLGILYFWGDINPDWHPYRLIYIEQGAWLAFTGRDGVFLSIIEAFRALPIISSSYESFRVTLALIFVYFSFALMSGRLVDFKTEYSLYILLPVLGILFVRSTIQVRECLALFFFFLAMRSFLLPSAKNRVEKNFRIISIALLFFFAAGTHGVGILLVFVFCVSYVLAKNTTRVSTIIGFFFIPFTLVIMFLLANQLGLVQSGVLFAQDIMRREAVEGGLTDTELLVWIFFIGLNLSLWLKTFQKCPDLRERASALNNFSRNLAGPCALVGGVLIIIMKSALISPVITVLVVRAAEASSSIAAFLVCALYGRCSVVLLISAFLLLKNYVQLSSIGVFPQLGLQ